MFTNLLSCTPRKAGFFREFYIVFKESSYDASFLKYLGTSATVFLILICYVTWLRCEYVAKGNAVCISTHFVDFFAGRVLSDFFGWKCLKTTLRWCFWEGNCSTPLFGREWCPREAPRNHFLLHHYFGFCGSREYYRPTVDVDIIVMCIVDLSVIKEWKMELGIVCDLSAPTVRLLCYPRKAWLFITF